MQSFRFLVLIFLLSLAAIAQTPQAPTSLVDDSFVQKQFGDKCKLVPGPAPAIADLNGDGIDDIVMVARCTNPMLDQTEHEYKVVDPYNSFFGYGNVKVTSAFASEDPDRRGL